MVLDQIGSISNIFELNKAGIFEYSFPEGGSGQFDPPSYLKKNYLILIQLYTIVEKSI